VQVTPILELALQLKVDNMASLTSILVLGAGELGDQVLQNLAKHPARGSTRIALLLRPSTASSCNVGKRADPATYRDLNIDLITGDLVYDTPSRLQSVMVSFHTVISCTGMTFPKGTQLKITEAALSAGVRRYFPWQFGIDYDTIGRNSAQDLFDEQLDVRDLLRAQNNTHWVVVSTGMFISFLFEPSFGVVDLQNGQVSAIGSWENELTVTCPEDIGRITAELALTAPEERGVVYVAGDTVSMAGLANIVEELLGKQIARELKTVGQLQDEIAVAPHDTMKKYRGVFGAGVGVAWDKGSSFNVRKGIETVMVKQWAQVNMQRLVSCL
jgi:hypothetical protein